MKIEILDTIECKCDAALAAIIRPCLSYTAVTYVQGPYRKIRKEYQKSTMSKSSSGHYYFYTGCLERVLNFCHEKNAPIELTGEMEKLPYGEIQLPRTFKPRQEQLEPQLKILRKALKVQRGVLKAPTGVGKTSVGIMLISTFPKDSRVLWLCHTKDLMYQAGKVAEKELGEKIGYIGDGHDNLDERLLGYSSELHQLCRTSGAEGDIVIADGHNLSFLSGQYANIPQVARTHRVDVVAASEESSTF